MGRTRKKIRFDVMRTNSEATALMAATATASSSPSSSSSSSSDVDENEMTFLTLNIDCIEEILGWMPLDDLARMSRTCKRLRMIIMEYFPRKYPYAYINIWNLGRGGIVLIPKLTWSRTFSHLLRDIRISGEDINIYRCVYERCNRQLSSLSISSRKLLNEHIKWIVDILKTIEELTLDDCMVENNLHFTILQHCKNMKRLHLRGFLFDLEKRGRQHQWLQHTYPHLELLELNYIRKEVYDHLIEFMQRNTTLKTFISQDLNVFSIVEIIKLSNVKLDELLFGLKESGIRLASKLAKPFDKYFTSREYRAVRNRMNELCKNINALYENGNYKRLFIKIWHGTVLIDFPKELKSLKELYGLDLCSEEIDNEELAVALASFTQLKSLNFYTIEKIAYAEILSRQLHNLEEIQIIVEKIDTSFPFIRNSPKLKRIIFKVVRNKDTNIDLKKLNLERTKLPGACKLTLYFEPDTYFTLKHALIEIKYPLLQIDHAASFNERNITF